jgi:hypothetical protein
MPHPHPQGAYPMYPGAMPVPVPVPYGMPPYNDPAAYGAYYPVKPVSEQTPHVKGVTTDSGNTSGKGASSPADK